MVAATTAVAATMMLMTTTLMTTASMGSLLISSSSSDGPAQEEPCDATGTNLHIPSLPTFSSPSTSTITMSLPSLATPATANSSNSSNADAASQTGRGPREDYDIVKKRNHKSDWWKYYKVNHNKHHRDDNECTKFAVCIKRLCEVNVSKGLAGLESHSSHKHRDLQMLIKHPNLSGAGDDGGSGQHTGDLCIDKLVGATVKQKKEVRDVAVLAAVIEENQPLNAVEKPAFRRLLKTLDETSPMIPTAIKIRDDIGYLGLVSRQALQRELHGKYYIH